MRTKIVAAILGTLLVLTILGGLSMLAVSSCQPDSPLYQVKLFNEDIRESLTRNNDSLFELKYTHMEKRFSEIAYSAQTGKELPSVITLRLQSALDQCLQLAALKDDTAQTIALQKIYELLAVQENIITMLQNQTQPAIATSLGEILTMLETRQQLVKIGIEQPNVFRVQILTGDLPAGYIAESNSTTPTLENLSSMVESTPTSFTSPTVTATLDMTPTPTLEGYDEDTPPDLDLDVTIVTEPTYEDDDDDIPPELEGKIIVTITPGSEDDDDLPPGIDEGDIVTEAPTTEDDDE